MGAKQAAGKLSIAYKTIFVFLLLSGILARADLFSDSPQLHTLYSFTAISNCFILLVTLASIYRTALGSINMLLSRFRIIGLMMILATGLIYHFILLPQKTADDPLYQAITYGNIIAHYVSPTAMLLDWILFDPKGRISKWEPMIFSAIPFGYFVTASIYGFFGPVIEGKDTSFVYFFMDWNKLGLWGVLSWILPILSGILLLTYSLYFVDSVWGKK